MESNVTSYTFKVVLLGEGKVGKTSILLRFVEDKFNNQHLSTIQASFLNKKINFDNNNRVSLNVWDTAGQEKFHALGPIYYRSSNGALLVYDICDEQSFQKIKVWIKELKKVLGQDISIIIVGNKIDMEKDRVVPLEEAVRYAEGQGAKHFQTSAKQNEGIDEIFIEISKDMIKAHNEKQLSTSTLLTQRSNSMRRTLVVEDDQNENNENDGTQRTNCCAR
ncbi:unnamed protein product [Diamesa serratosioi]